MAWSRQASWVAVLALPGAMLIYASFMAGGYFAGTPAALAVVAALVLVVRVASADDPLAGLSPAGILACSALAAFAVWTMASSIWSDAPGRAILEFDRALLYALVALLFASIPRTPARLAWIVRGMAGAIVVVGGAAFVTRTLPDVWQVELTAIHPERLSYPLTYWNGLGMLCAIGIILTFHLAASEREPAAVRAAGAAAIPLLCATLLLTFSRGSIAAGSVGVIAYVVAARPRALLGAVLATLPAAAIAVYVAYDADLLASTTPQTAAAADQGHGVALAVVLCMVGAGALRWFAQPLDHGLARQLERPGARRGLRLSFAGAAVVAIVVAVGLGAPGAVADQYDRFVNEGDRIENVTSPRQRLTDPSNNGRIRIWNVALKGYDAAPLKGTGAGTFELLWEQHRPSGEVAAEGHSLYVEVLGELGLVGLALVLVAVLALLVGIARRMRGPARAVQAVAFAVVLAWALRAGIDWDWELPAVTLPAIVLGAAAVAAEPGARALGRLQRPGRLIAGAALLVLAVTPALVGLSQRHLNSAVDAFKRNDCGTAIDQALAANRLMPSRSEPFEVLAYCDARHGAGEVAIAAMQNAAERDPGSSEILYGQAIVRATAGGDPFPALRRALELNPRDELLRKAMEDLSEASRRELPSVARQLQLPLP
jgi:hypothetical protein